MVNTTKNIATNARSIQGRKNNVKKHLTTSINENSPLYSDILNPQLHTGHVHQSENSL